MPDESKPKKKKHKNLPPQFYSEYSMWSWEFQRYHALFSWKDVCAMKVNSLDLSFCQPLYAVLMQIYKNIRWIFKVKDKDNLDKKFKELRNLINKEVHMRTRGIHHGGLNNINYRLFDLFDEIDQELMAIKQLAHLGIPVRKKESIYTKAKRALNA